MVFDQYGDSTLPALLLIHGMANTAQLCYGRVLPYLDGYQVILCELDGHTDRQPGLFSSIADQCEQIERYVAAHLGGQADPGFSDRKLHGQRERRHRGHLLPQYRAFVHPKRLPGCVWL
jgi:hypothetical protein